MLLFGILCENIPKLFSAEGHVNLSGIQIIDFVGMNCKNRMNIKIRLGFLVQKLYETICWLESAITSKKSLSKLIRLTNVVKIQ